MSTRNAPKPEEVVQRPRLASAEPSLRWDAVVARTGALADQLTSVIHLLQHAQYVLPGSATLADVHAVLDDLERRYSPQMDLEEVIQSLVGAHLARQLEHRRAREVPSEVA